MMIGCRVDFPMMRPAGESFGVYQMKKKYNEISAGPDTCGWMPPSREVLFERPRGRSKFVPRCCGKCLQLLANISVCWQMRRQSLNDTGRSRYFSCPRFQCVSITHLTQLG